MVAKRDFYERLLDGISDGVYFMDRDRIIRYWNHGAERITGFKKDEVIGTACRDNVLMHVDDAGTSLCLAEFCPALATITDGQERSAEVYLHHKEGYRLPVLARISDQEICKLRWDYEVEVPAFQTSVFVVPKERVKNRQDRSIVLNSVAKAVIEEVRGQTEEWVFTYKGHPISTMNTPAWKKARTDAGIPVRIHDLKHTYGRRLRAVGVSFDDRQDLLGHKSGRITTHYSAPELTNLIGASERICEVAGRVDTSVFLRKKNPVRLCANQAG
jgi:PAS domain S-box-containing protein